MTRVYAERDGSRCILSVQGHATGNERVCAAISGIVYALAGYLSNAVMERYIEIYEMQVEEAAVILDFYGDPGAIAAFEMAVIGLLQIEKQHPAYIQVVAKKIS